MEWRCAQCGRPHRTNSPPCECGSHDIERAVVRVTKRCATCGTPAGQHEDVCRECGFQSFEDIDPGPTAGELESSYLQWVCPECGKEYPRNTPPCDRCGAMTLEKEQVTDESFDVGAYVEGMEDGGSEAVPTWVLALVALALVAFVVLTYVL